MTVFKNTCLGLFLTLGAAHLAPNIAQAQPAANKASKARKATKTTKTAKTAKAKVPASKTRTMIFDGDELDADRFSPNGFKLYAAKRARHKSLIRLRSHFVSEILKSADDI